MPGYWDQFPDVNPDNPQGINTNIANGPPPGSASPTGTPVAPAWAGQPAANAPQYGGAQGGQQGGGQGDPVAFIRQWQATHPASVNAPQEIIAALQANGFNASPFMYGNTPSGNEINLNGEKFKVIGAENSGNPTWYRGENDLPGGGGFSLQGMSNVAPFQAPGILTPYTNELTNPSQADLENDPGYQFRLAQGSQAIQRQAAQRGTLKSGGTLKDLTAFGQGLASDEYNNLFNRNLQLGQFNRGTLWGNEQNAYNMLSGVSGQGLGAASQYANNATNLYSGQGAVNAAGTAQKANAWNNTLGNLGDFGSDLYDSYSSRPKPNRQPTV